MDYGRIYPTYSYLHDFRTVSHLLPKNFGRNWLGLGNFDSI